MIDGARLAGLLPHAGAMALLDAAVHWTERTIRCRASSHQDAGNPLRRAGRLSAVCGLEYGMQAAALHGALLAGGVAQRAGYLARLRGAMFHVEHLDDVMIGPIWVDATLEGKESGGMMYLIALTDTQARPLLEARVTIALPR